MKTTQLTKQLYSVKTLVDLNGDLVNFRIQFTLQSDPANSPFQVSILDETTLNHTETIQYQTVKDGVLKGEVKSDKNNYQRFYMILRADSPTVVNITLQTEELPTGTTPISDDSEMALTSSSAFSSDSSSDSSNSSYKLTFILIALVIVIGYVGLVYFRGKEGSSSTKGPSTRLNQSILAKLRKAQQATIGGTIGGTIGN